MHKIATLMWNNLKRGPEEVMMAACLEILMLNYLSNNLEMEINIFLIIALFALFYLIVTVFLNFIGTYKDIQK